jgi:acyl-CoA thioesterase-2
VWFRRDVDPCDWLLLDLQPGAAGGGLGVYTGTIRDRDGELGAFIAQQTLLRDPTPQELQLFAELIEMRKRAGR